MISTITQNRLYIGVLTSGKNDHHRNNLEYCCHEDLHLEQLNMKIIFFYEDLEEEIYMKQPQGFNVPRKKI